MRLFLAVNFPEAVRHRIYADAAPMRAASDAVSWVRALNLHVTIKFLGEQEQQVVAPLEEALRGVAARHVESAMDMAGVGAFPNLRRPRVVWIGVRDPLPLRRLADDVDAACAGLGFPREERPFRAHVTLGRVRRPLRPAEGAALEAAAREMRGHYNASLRGIDLMRSELAPGGSRYTVVATAPLTAAGVAR